MIPPTLVYNYSAALFHRSREVPRTHKEMLQRPDAAEWLAAEKKELDQVDKMNVKKLVVLPEGARLIPSKWAYDIKRTGVYKAHFVARGVKQRPGTDYDEIFANVVRPETLRLILAVVPILDLFADCVDIMTAFLNTLMPSDQPTFLRPPPGYESYDNQGQLLVWLLLRAIYGLCQSNQLWFLTITKFLGLHGFAPLPSDPCVL
jgi:hypothetical protein